MTDPARVNILSEIIIPALLKPRSIIVVQDGIVNMSTAK